jgi:hypothetical protein
MKRALVTLLAAGILAAPAGANRSHAVRLGVLGGIERFDSLTGQHTSVGHVIFAWGQDGGSPAWFTRLFAGMGEVPMLGISTGQGGITPLQVARGGGDAMLLALNAAIGEFGKPLYVRPFGEMNGHWNAYCAFTASGASKGPPYSTAAFRKAFARLYVILHGGTLGHVNAALRRLGLPPVHGAATLATNPYPRLKVIWNPQGYGSPDVPGNSAQDYFPGDHYVDVVGDDLYDIRGKAEWDAAEKLYAAHPTKPFAFPEWGLWGLDDPPFVQHIADWAHTHHRTELIAYYEGRPGSIFDLATKPASLKAYRHLISPLG